MRFLWLFRFGFLISLSGLNVSCYPAFVDYVHVQKEGKFFDSSQVNRLEIDKTTTAQCEEIFGEPLERHTLESGPDIWKYDSLIQKKHRNPSIIVKSERIVLEKNVLILVFQNGTLAWYDSISIYADPKSK